MEIHLIFTIRFDGMKSIKIALLIALFLGLNNANAQQATVASGGNATGSGGTVSYSLGQIDYISNISSSGTTMQGLQQPYEIFTTGISTIAIDLKLSVYPNPSMDFLTLHFENYILENAIYQITDMNGKLLESNKIIGSQTQICLDGLVSATYLLKVSTDSKELKVFKIIKL